MNKPKVSIILPTYNVEKFLTHCLNSVLAQTYKNYEVIIIIDGATDKSYEIAKEYCSIHENFNVFWQDNAGSGPARNAGLAKANGEFVMFIDPDDWIDENLLNNLILGQQDGDYDLVATQRIKVLCDNNGMVLKQIPLHYEEKAYDNEQSVRNAFFEMVTNNVADNPTQKLYKMSIIKEFGIQFPALKRSQDVVFNYRYYEHIKKLRLLHYSGYFYRVLLENSSGRSSADYYKVIEYIYNDYKSLYDKWKLPFPDKEFCTHLYEIRVFANLQRCAIQNWDVLPIFTNMTINHIIKYASPQSFVKRIALYLIRKERYVLLMKLMKMISLFKQAGIKR